jgi:hypothetical protein
MLRSVCCGVVEHRPADDGIVGSIVPVHGAVETMGGCANSSLGAGSDPFDDTDALLLVHWCSWPASADGSSSQPVRCWSGASCGRGHGTADGWVTVRGVLVDAKSCGDHAGVHAGESGVWVDGDIVKDPGERLLVYDQCLDVSHRDL